MTQPSPFERLSTGHEESTGAQDRLDAGLASGYNPEFEDQAQQIRELVKTGNATPTMTAALGYHEGAKAAHERILKGQNT